MEFPVFSGLAQFNSIQPTSIQCTIFIHSGAIQSIVWRSKHLNECTGQSNPIHC